jgi:hypothetical protein
MLYRSSAEMADVLRFSVTVLGEHIAMNNLGHTLLVVGNQIKKLNILHTKQYMEIFWFFSYHLLTVMLNMKTCM